MLRVTLEVVPRGKEEIARKIGTMEIINDETGIDTQANYDVEMVGEDGFLRVYRLEKFNRLKNDAWDLIREALKIVNDD